jgi:hypothetical protein
MADNIFDLGTEAFINTHFEQQTPLFTLRELGLQHDVGLES